MADGETHIRGNWRPLARDHAQFRPNKTRAALHPVIHTHVRVRDGFFIRASERVRAFVSSELWNRARSLSTSLITFLLLSLSLSLA